MNMNNTTSQTNYDYFKQRWRDSAPQTKRKWRIFLAVLGALWLGGAITAFSNVAGIMRLGSGARILTALAMGPFGLPWGFLKWTDVISETIQEPNLFWLLLLGLNVGILWLVGKILTGEPNQLVQQQRKQAAAEKECCGNSGGGCGFCDTVGLSAICGWVSGDGATSGAESCAGLRPFAHSLP